MKIIAHLMPFWILDWRFWIEESLAGQASHLGSHSAHFINCISKPNGYHCSTAFALLEGWAGNQAIASPGSENANKASAHASSCIDNC